MMDDSLKFTFTGYYYYLLQLLATELYWTSESRPSSDPRLLLATHRSSCLLFKIKNTNNYLT